MRGRAAFDETRDLDAPAQHAPSVATHLLCTAPGCGNRWTLDLGGRQVCRDHSRPTRAEPRFGARVASEAERRQLAAGLRRIGGPKEQPKAWAHALKAREEAGEILTPTQREAWRNALREHLNTNEEIDR